MSNANPSLPVEFISLGVDHLHLPDESGHGRARKPGDGGENRIHRAWEVYTYRIYFSPEVAMMGKARVFKSGNSQAVRLPKQFRFEVDEVEILRRGHEIVLRELKRNLGEAFAALGTMPDDFMADDRQDQPPQKREAL